MDLSDVSNVVAESAAVTEPLAKATSGEPRALSVFVEEPKSVEEASPASYGADLVLGLHDESAVGADYAAAMQSLAG